MLIARWKTERLPFVPSWQLLILGALTLWLYGSTLGHLVGQWWNDPNFSHGFFVPLFSAFVLWQERDRLAQIPTRPSWAGLIVLLVGLVVLIVGRLGAELFLARSSLLLVLAGLVILFFGWNLFRAVLFPWAFLLMMIPIPSIALNQITFPLQLLASKVAATVLPVLGVPIFREGNVINLPAMALEVAEACSGIRSLMSLVTLAIIYGYLMEKRLWVRWLLAFAAVPITVAANDVRIIGTGLLVQYWDPEAAEGYFHASWGWIIFVVSLLMLYALHGLVRFLFPEKDSRSDEGSASATARTSSDSRNSVATFVLATVLIAAAAVFLQSRARSEVFPERLVLKSFPRNSVDGPALMLPSTRKSSTSSAPVTFFCASIRIRRQTITSISLSPTSAASAPETPSIPPSTAFPALAGRRSRTSALHLTCRATCLFPRTVISSQREILGSSFCIGSGPTIAEWPVSIGPSSIWSPIPSS